LQVCLKIFHSFLSWISWPATDSSTVDSLSTRYFRKLKRTTRKLYWRVLINQTFMKSTKCFVFLVRYPALTIKIYLNNIFCICSVIIVIFDHLWWLYSDRQWQLKEMWPSCSSILWTSFNMLNKYLCWMENLTKFALHRQSMF
jgi:hypothetical protein